MTIYSSLSSKSHDVSKLMSFAYSPNVQGSFIIEVILKEFLFPNRDFRKIRVVAIM